MKKNLNKKKIVLALFISLIFIFAGCEVYKAKENQEMIIKATNKNITYGDAPAISLTPDGSEYVTLPLNSSLEFTVNKSNPNLYLWTCEHNCIWKPFLTPTKKGKSIDYNVFDPADRKLTFTRIK